ncbi:MAG: GerMN domain-containing protein [Tissierellales bacterium]
MGNKPKIIPLIIFILLLMGCQTYTVLYKDDLNYPPINPMPEGYQVDISLFFPRKESDILVEEVRKVNLENKKLETVVMDELLKGTKKEDLRNVIPSGAKILSIHLQGSVAYVNFNKALINEKIVENEEVLIIYSIVNSLASIEDIDNVQILIEGEKKDKYSKHILNEPIGFSKLLIVTPYYSPNNIIQEYYDALLKRDFRKMFKMGSVHDVNESKYDLFESYYETQELGLANYQINNVEIIKYDNEIILLYELSLYYSDGRIGRDTMLEMGLKYVDNRFVVTTIRSY